MVMLTRRSDARCYSVLCGLAIPHSFLLTATLVAGATRNAWGYRVWLGVATVWFLWPFVLWRHPGRSILRVAVALVVAAPVWILAYVGAGIYCSAYVRGWFEAQRDIKADTLAVEGYGMWGPSWDTRVLLRERYHVEIGQTAGCVVNESILGHAKGYNHVSIPVIEQRLGKKFLESFGAQPFSELD